MQKSYLTGYYYTELIYYSMTKYRGHKAAAARNAYMDSESGQFYIFQK